MKSPRFVKFRQFIKFSMPKLRRTSVWCPSAVFLGWGSHLEHQLFVHRRDAIQKISFPDQTPIAHRLVKVLPKLMGRRITHFLHCAHLGRRKLTPWRPLGAGFRGVGRSHVRVWSCTTTMRITKVRCVPDTPCAGERAPPLFAAMDVLLWTPEHVTLMSSKCIYYM